jgi:hypothetical protein
MPARRRTARGAPEGRDHAALIHRILIARIPPILAIALARLPPILAITPTLSRDLDF